MGLFKYIKQLYWFRLVKAKLNKEAKTSHLTINVAATLDIFEKQEVFPTQ